MSRGEVYDTLTSVNLNCDNTVSLSLLEIKCAKLQTPLQYKLAPAPPNDPLWIACALLLCVDIIFHLRTAPAACQPHVDTIATHDALSPHPALPAICGHHNDP